ncbi:carbohydrate sulfotransferase 11-like [Spea bombifrons]|uniref:carbohydrate sulfotransferase 11-like n=1 Tax=Spea bombifrons TaxID=233779 RepID=UPI00234AB03A|nr:carbohydrate sulfotransferase 11-like [Spea bombifrons]
MRFLLRIFTVFLGVGFLCLWTWMLHVTSTQPTDHQEAKDFSTLTPDTFLHVQQLRKKKLRSFCLENPKLSGLQSVESAEHLLSRMTANEKLQMVYCKAGATGIDAWEELLEVLTEKDDVTIETPVVDLHNLNSSLTENQENRYNLAMVEKVFRSYTKIIFVRDPFERLVSAYTQGFAGEITFSEFLEDVLSLERGTRDDSGTTMVSLCQPCFVQYDYIIMLDFLRAEVFHLMKRMGIPEAVLRPKFSNIQSQLTHKWLTQNLFRGLTSEQITQLSEVYQPDLEAFPFYNSLLLNNSNGKIR